eukprot:768261-Hanusia_phi.AAC.9
MAKNFMSCAIRVNASGIFDFIVNETYKLVGGIRFRRATRMPCCPPARTVRTTVMLKRGDLRAAACRTCTRLQPLPLSSCHKSQPGAPSSLSSPAIAVDCPVAEAVVHSVRTSTNSAPAGSMRGGGV